MRWNVLLLFLFAGVLALSFQDNNTSFQNQSNSTFQYVFVSLDSFLDNSSNLSSDMVLSNSSLPGGAFNLSTPSVQVPSNNLSNGQNNSGFSNNIDSPSPFGISPNNVSTPQNQSEPAPNISTTSIENLSLNLTQPPISSPASNSSIQQNVSKKSKQSAFPKKLTPSDFRKLVFVRSGLSISRELPDSFELEVIKTRTFRFRVRKSDLVGVSPSSSFKLFDVDVFDLRGGREMFAVNPKTPYQITVEAVATGTKLYKCASWNFSSRTCQGSWKFIMDLTPGEPYTITVNGTDPGFAEQNGNITSCTDIIFSGIYNVTANITANGETCIRINTSDVVLDLKSHSISGSSGLWNASILINSTDVSNITVKNGVISSSYLGLFASNASQLKLDNLTIYSNSYGVYLSNVSSPVLSSLTVENNSIDGVFLDQNTASASVSSSRMCGNANIDIHNLGSGNTGSGNRCDSFFSWDESGIGGCLNICSYFWSRLTGTVDSILQLSSSNNVFFSWPKTVPSKIMFYDADSQIDWSSLVAIGRNSSGGATQNDFADLDQIFGSSAYYDNISTTYTSDGSNPKEIKNLTIAGVSVPYVPLASSSWNTTFKTGIVWDSSKDTNGEFDVSDREPVVWVVETNASSQTPYGLKDYISQIPGNLGSYEGSQNVVYVYADIG